MGKIKESCSLCGGKLKNGICTECGMDNRKNDGMYKSMLNQGEHYSLNTAQPQTSEHLQRTQSQTAEQPQKTQSQTAEQWQQAAQSYRTQHQKAKKAEKAAKDSSQKKYPNASGNRNIFTSGQPYTPRQFTGAQKSTGRKNGGLTAFFIGIFALVVILSLVGIFESQESEDSFATDIYVENIPEDTPENGQRPSYGEEGFVDNTEEQLSPIGATWEKALPAGLYVVGSDIPEGEYTISGGEGNSCFIRDEKNSIYSFYSFGTQEYDVEAVEGERLFSGAVVSVTGFAPIAFFSHNAQIDAMTAKMPNPVTESVEIAAEAVAGEDFPPGIYDVEVMENDFGILQFSMEEYEGKEPPFLDSSLLLEKNPTEKNPEYSDSYRGVIFPEGTKVTTDITVKLVPCPEIAGTDYLGIYQQTETENKGQEQE